MEDVDFDGTIRGDGWMDARECVVIVNGGNYD